MIVRNDSAEKNWIVVPRPLQHASRRLICLAHAGAGASIYPTWASRLAAHGIELCAIQYPGRENRIGEPAISEARDMVRQMADFWPVITGGRRCALFGHSMGCLLSHELVIELDRRRAPALPECLLVSGRHPPHLPNPEPPIHALDDQGFLGELQRRYGALPAELLADQEMRCLIVAVLKNDFRLVETYAPSPAALLPVPIAAFYGDNDHYTHATGMAQWQQYTQHTLSVHRIRGDHFFHQSNSNELLPLVARHVLSVAPLKAPTQPTAGRSGADGAPAGWP